MKDNDTLSFNKKDFTDTVEAGKAELKRLADIVQELDRLREAEQKRLDKIKADEKIKKYRFPARQKQLIELGLSLQAGDYVSDYANMSHEHVNSIGDQEWASQVLFVKELKEKHEAAEEEMKRVEAQKTERQQKLIKLGLVFDGEQFKYKDVNFHWTDIVCMEKEEFDRQYTDAEARMADLREQEAEMRKAAETQAKAEEEKQRKEKLAADAKLKQEREARQKVEEELRQAKAKLAQKPDVGGGEMPESTSEGMSTDADGDGNQTILTLITSNGYSKKDYDYVKVTKENTHWIMFKTGGIQMYSYLTKDAEFDKIYDTGIIQASGSELQTLIEVLTNR